MKSYKRVLVSCTNRSRAVGDPSFQLLHGPLASPAHSRELFCLYITLTRQYTGF